MASFFLSTVKRKGDKISIGSNFSTVKVFLEVHSFDQLKTRGTHVWTGYSKTKGEVGNNSSTKNSEVWSEYTTKYETKY